MSNATRSPLIDRLQTALLALAVGVVLLVWAFVLTASAMGQTTAPAIPEVPLPAWAMAVLGGIVGFGVILTAFSVVVWPKVLKMYGELIETKAKAEANSRSIDRLAGGVHQALLNTTPTAPTPEAIARAQEMNP